MLEQLKRLIVDVAPLEELIAGRMIGRLLKAEFEELGEDVPGLIDDKLRQIARAINMKLDEKRALAIRDTRAELERLTPAAERRITLEKKLKALLKQQGVDVHDKVTA